MNALYIFLSADKINMEFSKMLPVILQVFTSRTVIIAVIAVVLYLNFVAYVQHYHKKAPPVRKAVKKAVAAQAAGEQKADGDKTGEESAKADDSDAPESAAESKKTSAKK